MSNNIILDKILALQIMVAWAGEGACEPKRLDWWRTDLIDEYGGGDLFTRFWLELSRLKNLGNSGFGHKLEG